MTKDEALKLALAVLKEWHKGFPDDWTDFDTEAVTAIKEALAQHDSVQAKPEPEHDNTYIYASSLATAIWQKYYMKESPKFALLDTTEGVLTQIDNMACGLVREKPEQPEQEPVAFICQGNVYMADDVDKYCTAKHIPLYTKEQL